MLVSKFMELETKATMLELFASAMISLMH